MTISDFTVSSKLLTLIYIMYISPNFNISSFKSKEFLENFCHNRTAGIRFNLNRFIVLLDLKINLNACVLHLIIVRCALCIQNSRYTYLVLTTNKLIWF